MEENTVIYRSDVPPDKMEQDLLKVRALIDSTVARRRQKLAENSLVRKLGLGRKELVAEIGRQVNRSRNSVDILLPDDLEVAGAALEAVKERLSPAAPTVTVRVLCAPGCVDESLVRRMEEDERLTVRTSRSQGLTASIIDGRTALVCADPTLDARASTLHAPSVIRALEKLFESMWQASALAAGPIDFGNQARSDMAREVLRCLRLGLTDEVAARELSISVRTYRRYVADIMKALAADSRFQAGVRAAALGLLPPGGKGGGDPASRSSGAGTHAADTGEPEPPHC
ncbi:helix-turn-helix transcriptional regulator [Actinacidiphila acidipaludis]|uniref:Helix-turn-helix transcriptional regulator n=1 Tax=Actinacidiphila acidipaludis TaxID=2873382 RepID=A0ABS7Q9I4_9ACTN|nr:helix-turn-helix transcriptional regulator [Streptomyces acidipaludis]MBY8879786.1 helix-turn-helix transcriptional regulator [Streptomyces acidipaludis]